ncbi:MAG: penicillin-binding protein [Candidatus Binatia bacterium]
MTATVRHPLRLGLACVALAAVLGVIAARLCQLALVDGERLGRLARRQHAETEQVMPLRGAILDRTGEALAMSIHADSVFIRPALLRDGHARDAVARALGVAPKRWLQKISSPSPFVWLQRQAGPDVLETVQDLKLPGLGTIPERRRVYPHGRMAAAVIGFAGIDSQGLEGIELFYDRYLRGSPTEVSVERDARGRKFSARAIERDLPRYGANVVLTLDASLQYVAERELDRQVGETRAKGGLVLVLDPRRGEILALAQNPSFDPNQASSVDPDLRRDRAVADAFEPGSTMKGLLAAAALEHRAVSARDRFFCENGSYRFAGETIHDHHRHGVLSFAQVFQVSSNICATKIGQRLGARTYYQSLRAFGFGSPTAVDLAGEQAGILRSLAAWKPIDLATASFGQGVVVTPMQLAVAYASLANGGILMRPYIVKQVVDVEGEVLLENQPTVVRRVVSEATAREVTTILEGVVAPKGTAPAAAIPGIRIAGKTGTAQKVDFVRGGYSRGRIASFVGYFPAEDPEVVMLVVVDEPHTTIWGGTAAAPLFRTIALAAIERLGIRAAAPSAKHRTVAEVTTVLTSRSGHPVPASFVGLSLREAIERAHAEGVEIELVGSGYVVRQDPMPGKVPQPGAPIRLELDAEGPRG